MNICVHSTWIRNIATVVSCGAILGGCLSEEKDNTTFNGENTNDVELSGSVGDGPVVGASMSVTSKSGELLAEFQSDSNAGYNITITTLSEDYPLSIEATGGTDLVTNQPPDFMLKGAALNSGATSIANVSPFTTLAVELAQNLAGGVTSNNLEDAQELVTNALNSGLDSIATTGAMSTRIDAGNIAEIVKASETLSESIRRTRDRLQAAGFASSGNSVVGDLAADLPDGVIDGSGTGAADRRTAAVSTIVNAQVLLESMANELHVGGTIATATMQNAIVQVEPGSSVSLDQLPVTAGMISKTRIGLAAAFAIDPDPAIRQLHGVVSGLQAGQNATLVRVAFPSDYRSVLGNALGIIAGADAATLDLVNSIARTGGELEAENLAPGISGSPQTATQVGSEYSFTPTASDPDGDALTFSVSSQPSWATFDSATGGLGGAPAVGDVGSYPNIVISVSDGEFSASLLAFTITVSESNTTPQISGSPATSVNAGENYSFTPTATDPEGDILTFSITNTPSWASFNNSTGRLSGSPSNGDAGTYSGIVISVSDGEFSAGLSAFSITVNSVATNTAPEISGAPATSVNEGQQYSFTPSASDADGDPLTFSISNRPSWANFNTSTGRLQGTPGAADVGTYSNIVISVSDGQASDSLPAFGIAVQAISLGSASLSWTAPTENEDGTPLTDLAGYKLYWGTTPGNYPNSVTINNATVTTYLVENLSPGSYEFVAKSFNASGVESRFSGTATKIIP